MEKVRQLARALIFLAGGLACFSLTAAFAFLAWRHVSQGAGSESFGFVSAFSVLYGAVAFIGLILAALLSFAAGVGLCACGVVPPDGMNKAGRPDEAR